jgi:signal transduction histidine kinase
VDAVRRITFGRVLFGPWPFATIPIAIVGTLGYFSRAVSISGASAGGSAEFLSLLLRVTLLGVAITFLAVLPMAIADRWQRRHGGDSNVPRRAVYLAVIALTAVIASALQTASRYVVRDELTGRGIFESVPLSFAASFAVIFTFALAATNAVGYFTYRISRQRRELERQVQRLEEQRRAVVEADQRIRTEVARALHDDVQGALLRAVLRLNRLAEDAPASESEALRVVIGDLEELRGQGVRRISRRLAPPIDSVGISSALGDLAETYRGSIDVHVEIDPAARAALAGRPDGELAAYPIVEQALLNAGAHGAATRSWVRIAPAPDGAVELVVEDDGRGLAGAIEPGMGLAVVDAWVGIDGGAWRLEARSGGGAVLTARLPVAGA